MERTFDQFENDFRKDFDTRYKSKGHTFDRYRPAYQFGFDAYRRHSGRNWQASESELRTDWQRMHPNEPWDEFKDAIHTGFEQAEHPTQQMGQGSQHMGQGSQSMGQGSQSGFDRTTGAMSHNFDAYERDFRNDFDRTFGTRGFDYQHYRPAYQYGYTLATENRYRGRNWNEVEPDARRDWQTKHPGDAWDDFKDAVRNAYQRVASDVKSNM